MISDRQDTLYAQFTDAHLTSEIQRAVFWVLAGSQDRVWTATDVARDAQVSDHEADLVLRRFKAAGILARVDEPGYPRRYRWPSQMAYLHDGSEPPPGRHDPVCGMPVPADSPHLAEYDGQEISFCSLSCLVLWRRQHRGRHRPNPVTVRRPRIRQSSATAGLVRTRIPAAATQQAAKSAASNTRDLTST